MGLPIPAATIPLCTAMLIQHLPCYILIYVLHWGPLTGRDLRTGNSCPPRLSVPSIGDVSPELHGEECQNLLVLVKCCANDQYALPREFNAPRTEARWRVHFNSFTSIAWPSGYWLTRSRPQTHRAFQEAALSSISSPDWGPCKSLCCHPPLAPGVTTFPAGSPSSWRLSPHLPRRTNQPSVRLHMTFPFPSPQMASTE